MIVKQKQTVFKNYYCCPVLGVIFCIFMLIGCYCEACGVMPHYKPVIQVLVGQSALEICICDVLVLYLVYYRMLQVFWSRSCLQVVRITCPSAYIE